LQIFLKQNPEYKMKKVLLALAVAAVFVACDSKKKDETPAPPTGDTSTVKPMDTPAKPMDTPAKPMDTPAKPVDTPAAKK
jgi:type IV pilus biogenesis protein CpaD/CtpE